ARSRARLVDRPHPHRRQRRHHGRGSLAARRAAAKTRRPAQRARDQLDRPPRRRRGRAAGSAQAALSARARCPAAERRPPAAPMIGFVARLFARGAPVLSQAGARDAAAIASLHAASFHRGWSEEEFERLLIDRGVLAHRAMLGRSLVGFIISRMVGDEAEILSVAVTARRRNQGVARRLLDLHLRRLAGLGVRTIFLEVSETNAPARALYRRAGFREAGRRAGYYPEASGTPAAALVMRCELRGSGNGRSGVRGKAAGESVWASISQKARSVFLVIGLG